MARNILNTPHFDSDGDNSAQAMTGGPAVLSGLQVLNVNTSDAWIQLYDLATTGVTVGSTTPTLSLLVPKGDGTSYGGLDLVFSTPVFFKTALTYACTTTPTGSGDPTTGLTVNAWVSSWGGS